MTSRSYRASSLARSALPPLAENRALPESGDGVGGGDWSRLAGAAPGGDEPAGCDPACRGEGGADGECERVRVDDPLHAGQAGVQVASDVRQRRQSRR